MPTLKKLAFTIGMLLLPLSAHATYFTWVNPHTALPSEAQALSDLSLSGVTTATEGILNNTSYNGVVIPPSDLVTFYNNPNGFATNPPGVLPIGDYIQVTGILPRLMGATPSTDQILAFYSIKWGIDQDTARAQAWTESTWIQSTQGDQQTVIGNCTQTGFPWLWNAGASNCDQSYGIYQDKLFYFTTAWPAITQSTSFAADFREASERGCINGDELPYFTAIGADLTAKNGHNSYATDVSGCAAGTTADCTDLFNGCVGVHFDPSSWWGGSLGSGCGTQTGAYGYMYSCVLPAVTGNAACTANGVPYPLCTGSGTGGYTAHPWPGGL